MTWQPFCKTTRRMPLPRVVDRLLGSSRYGERWGRHWLDVARFADSNGLDENLSYANAFHYRDYVIRAFNSDKPFDRFVQEQIAGDLLPASVAGPGLDRFIATGFLAVGAKMLAEDDPVKMQMDIIDEQLNVLCQAFMGLTMGCARCHDHKFDPIPTKDYYSLAGIFKSTKTMENHNVVAVWYERPIVDATTEQTIREIDQQIAKIDEQTKQLREHVRHRARLSTRDQVGEYLLAGNELDRFDALLSTAQMKTESPFSVDQGYAIIEAEAFHRGNIEIATEGYGEGIGVILSRGAGFVEYDLDVTTAGRYQFEVRHAAADSRPLTLIVNGKQVDDRIAEQVTGTWYPDSQNWFRTATLELTAGHNTIRLESAGVYPHVDKFAIILDATDWPFATSRPPSIVDVAQIRKLQISMVRQWQTFLHNVAASKHPTQTVFKFWTEICDLDAKGIADRFSQADVDLPESFRIAWRSSNVRTKEDVAKLITDLVRQIDAGEITPEDPLARQFNHAKVPLAGPQNAQPFRTASEASELQQLELAKAKLGQSRPTPPVAMGVTEGQPTDLPIHIRGSHIALGETAPRRFPRILDNRQTNISMDGSGRWELARWMTRQDHPLTSRVIANRLWHWHFGVGLVPSVDNFGKLGDPPSHPQLLDWLATELTNNRWSLKHLHRQIMLSSTYQMSTQSSTSAAAIDPENRLLWRMNRRRLSAEEIRDSIIAHGTGIDGTIGGSLLKVKNRAYVTNSNSSLTNEYTNERRSVYLPVVRSAIYDVLQTWDFPDPTVPNGRRQVSTVAPQALMMMNSELVEKHTRACAEHLMAAHSGEQERIGWAYRQLLLRAPDPNELKSARRFLDDAMTLTDDSRANNGDCEVIAWQSFCRVLMSTNEYFYVE